MAEEYRREDTLANTYVYDDGIVRGMIRVDGVEVIKLYVDTFFQGRGIGAELLEFAIEKFGQNYLCKKRETSYIIQHATCSTHA